MGLHLFISMLTAAKKWLLATRSARLDHSGEKQTSIELFVGTCSKCLKSLANLFTHTVDDFVADKGVESIKPN